MRPNLPELLKEYLQAGENVFRGQYNKDALESLKSYQALTNSEPSEQCEIAVLAATQLADADATSMNDKRCGCLEWLLLTLLRRKLPFTNDQFTELCEQMLRLEDRQYSPRSNFAGAVSRFHKAKGEFTPRQIGTLKKICAKWSEGNLDELDWSRKLNDVFRDAGIAPAIQLSRNGDVFAEAMLDAIDAMDSPERDAWACLLARAMDCSTGKPSAKWEKLARETIHAVGEEAFCEHLCRWLPFVDKPARQATPEAEVRIEGEGFVTYGQPSYTIDPMSLGELHLDVLKGLAWMSGLVANDELTRVLGFIGVSAYKKIPGVGPRATRLGNACVWALGNLGTETALSQLAVMKVRVKFGTAQKAIAKALDKVAEKVGVTAEELEEMSVPSYGLTDVGRLEERLGEFTAVLEVSGNKPVLSFLKPDGKPQKSVPVSVKKNFADELKDIKGSAKDLEKMLSAQKERLDNLYLHRKSWPLAIWKARYLDHPVVGILARRLIWNFKREDKTDAAIWYENELRTLNGPLADLPDETQVDLWHPLHSETKDIVAWRNWLFEHLIQQPFKQAHREIYLLTDAERNTATYSNRFASHVLKQHQFNSLCALRGWKNQLRLMVDADYAPPFKELTEWGLRAEFWVEGIGDDYNDEYVVESGAYRYLSTDQVRFYKIDANQVSAHAGGGGYHAGWGQTAADPLPIDQVPDLAFSEIFRDVDLFVGVTSVGNDPNWYDGGPEGRHADYWHGFSFGDLGETAQVRKELLEALLPRLKIAQQCRLEDKFLIVEGSKRTYKIHLGSGNILMEPNDQYLCIVKAPSKGKKTDLFLPFEGDSKLAVILSKAFLLAADDKISDQTILSQIDHH